MEFFVSLKNSFLLPKKEALFRLNRVSMRNTITYIVILLFLLFLPDVIQSVIHFEGNTDIPRSMYILQLVVMYPFLIIFLSVAGISLLALGSYLLKMIFNRKLIYQQLWKMTTFALTIPLILYTLLKHNVGTNGLVNVIPIIILYVLIGKMITVFPKRK
ncbi:DUF1189 family protein [Salinibacillus xinjiangensis]|uniref:DUF1189 domain-containing protein n=1 Tax=Salinibacillus xinjiangensis TaxID=1229268 RepID=A0A6G1X3Z4_9BACI|nr:DUF1189 family protein [Salinibacillus xinjiangensis]MRG85713.1 DUF1189 domain-containing protein [Salinibacillus xinjiangensis]